MTEKKEIVHSYQYYHDDHTLIWFQEPSQKLSNNSSVVECVKTTRNNINDPFGMFATILCCYQINFLHSIKITRNNLKHGHFVTKFRTPIFNKYSFIHTTNSNRKLKKRIKKRAIDPTSRANAP